MLDDILTSLAFLFLFKEERWISSALRKCGNHNGIWKKKIRVTMSIRNQEIAWVTKYNDVGFYVTRAGPANCVLFPGLHSTIRGTHSQRCRQIQHVRVWMIATTIRSFEIHRCNTHGVRKRVVWPEAVLARTDTMTLTLDVLVLTG